jgi:hypothetical protein
VGKRDIKLGFEVKENQKPGNSLSKLEDKVEEKTTGHFYPACVIISFLTVAEKKKPDIH